MLYSHNLRNVPQIALKETLFSNRLFWFYSRNIFFLHNMKQRKRNDFFFATPSSLFFFKAKLLSTSPSFLHKKCFITYGKYFFKKRDRKRFVPKNKSVSRGRAEIIKNTSDTQFSCLPQNYSLTSNKVFLLSQVLKHT